MPTGSPVRADFYQVLGVGPAAGGDEIARAFRARAKQLHPDTSDDPDAGRKFSDLVAAYDALSNHRTRREYDRMRATAPALVERNRPAATSAAAPKRWSRRRAWTALVAGTLVALLGVGAALLTWRLHETDANRHARFHPVTAVRVGDGEISFTTPDGHEVLTREPQQHGEGASLGPTVRVRYDPADPARVIVDANTVGRDITLAIVALKLLIGGVVFAVLGARRLRSRAETAATAAR